MSGSKGKKKKGSSDLGRALIRRAAKDRKMKKEAG